MTRKRTLVGAVQNGKLVCRNGDTDDIVCGHTQDELGKALVREGITGVFTPVRLLDDMVIETTTKTTVKKAV